MKNAVRSARKKQAQELVNELNTLIKKYPGEELLLDTDCKYIVVDRPLWKEFLRWALFVLIAFGLVLIQQSLLPKCSSQLLSSLLTLVFVVGIMVCANRIYDALWEIAFFTDRQYRSCCKIGYTKSNLEALDRALRRAQIVIEVYTNRLKKVQPILDVIDDLRLVIIDELGGSVQIEKGSLKPFWVKFEINGEETCFDLEAKDALPNILRFVVDMQHISVHDLETATGGGFNEAKAV